MKYFGSLVLLALISIAPLTVAYADDEDVALIYVRSILDEIRRAYRKNEYNRLANPPAESVTDPAALAAKSNLLKHAFPITLKTDLATGKQVPDRIVNDILANQIRAVDERVLTVDDVRIATFEGLKAAEAKLIGQNMLQGKKPQWTNVDASSYSLTNLVQQTDLITEFRREYNARSHAGIPASGRLASTYAVADAMNDGLRAMYASQTRTTKTAVVADTSPRAQVWCHEASGVFALLKAVDETTSTYNKAVQDSEQNNRTGVENPRIQPRDRWAGFVELALAAVQVDNADSGGSASTTLDVTAFARNFPYGTPNEARFGLDKLPENEKAKKDKDDTNHGK